MRIIPKNTKIKMTFYKGITLSDVIVGFVGLVLVAIALSSNLSFRFLIAGGIMIAFIPLFISVNGDRLYKIVGYFFKHLVSRKKFRKAQKGETIKNDIQSIVPYERICGNGIIALKDLRFAGVMEIHPVDFRMLGEFDQNALIDGTFARVLNNVAVGAEADIVKLERSLLLDNFVSDEMERIVKIAESKEKCELTDKEYETRVDVIQDRITTIDEMNSSKPILYARYYLVAVVGYRSEDFEQQRACSVYSVFDRQQFRRAQLGRREKLCKAFYSGRSKFQAHVNAAERKDFNAFRHQQLSFARLQRLGRRAVRYSEYKGRNEDEARRKVQSGAPYRQCDFGSANAK